MQLQSEGPRTLMVDQIIGKLIKHKKKSNVLSEQQIKGLTSIATQIFLNQKSLVRADAPITVCGDIHGQFRDLIRIFDTNGYPSNSNKYMFLGDYVDRGLQGVESICLLLAYKIKYPEGIYLLRGNHQCASLNKVYGFYNECCRKYSPTLWKDFVHCFDCIPPAGLISGMIFCVHGGISNKMTYINQIQNIRRPCDIGNEGLITDLLWADPAHAPSVQLFDPSPRGVSKIFGSKAVDMFCKVNDIELITRAHQIVEDGYRFSFEKKLITIFSAPNYCNKFNNAGGILKINEEVRCHIVTIPPILEIKQTHQKRLAIRSSTPVQIESTGKMSVERRHTSKRPLPYPKTKKIFKPQRGQKIRATLRKKRLKYLKLEKESSSPDVEQISKTTFNDFGKLILK